MNVMYFFLERYEKFFFFFKLKELNIFVQSFNAMNKW